MTNRSMDSTTWEKEISVPIKKQHEVILPRRVIEQFCNLTVVVDTQIYEKCMPKR